MAALANRDELPLSHQSPDTPAAEWGRKWRHGQQDEVTRPPADTRALDPDAIANTARAALSVLSLCVAIQGSTHKPRTAYDEGRERRLVRAHDHCFGIAGRLIRRGDELSELQEAAKAGDAAAFLDALPRVKWERQSEANFIRGVRLALEAGAHAAARELSAKGARRHPESTELGKQAYILAPPRVIRGQAATNSTHRANRDWLKAHGEEYHGQWVALRDGELLGVANTMEELTSRLSGTKGILLTIV